MSNKRRDLLRKQNRMINSMLDHAAEYMKEEFAYLYANVIVGFYENYDPIRYRRTFSTFAAGLEGRYNKPEDYVYNPKPRVDIKPINGGEGREIKMHISPDYMGDPCRAATDWVFDRTYVEGIHGFARSDIGWLGDNGSFQRTGKIPRMVKSDRKPKHRMDSAIIQLKKGRPDGLSNTGGKTMPSPAIPKYRSAKEMMQAGLLKALKSTR